MKQFFQFCSISQTNCLNLAKKAYSSSFSQIPNQSLLKILPQFIHCGFIDSFFLKLSLIWTCSVKLSVQFVKMLFQIKLLFHMSSLVDSPVSSSSTIFHYFSLVAAAIFFVTVRQIGIDHSFVPVLWKDGAYIVPKAFFLNWVNHSHAFSEEPTEFKLFSVWPSLYN